MSTRQTHPEGTLPHGDGGDGDEVDEGQWEHSLSQRVVPEELRPPIEVEVVRDLTGRAAADQASLAARWRAYEIWTGNRIYGLNRDLVCIEVLNRPTNTLDPQHPLIGAKLVCGQRQYRNSVHVAYPLPVPGTTAAFLRAMPPNMPKGRPIPASVTSKVERVVMRVLVSSVPLSENAGSEVTSAFLKF